MKILRSSENRVHREKMSQSPLASISVGLDRPTTLRTRAPAGTRFIGTSDRVKLRAAAAATASDNGTNRQSVGKRQRRRPPEPSLRLSNRFVLFMLLPVRFGSRCRNLQGCTQTVRVRAWFGLSRVQRPTRHSIGHFGGGLHRE